MTISAMKQALEALALVASSDEWHGCQTYEGQVATSAYEALRQAIEQAEKQEPAFYVIPATDRFGEGYEQTFWEDPAGFPVYTAPPKREWVGLTDEERRSIREWQRIQEELGPVWAPMMLYLYLAIEAKLKEKNA